MSSSQKTFNKNISQLILTQDNPIMKEVYTQMLKDYELNIITVPNPQFDNLRKNNPELYSQLTNYLKSKPQNIGLYDDNQENLKAANQIGILTQLATGIKNDDINIITKEASKLVHRLFDIQNNNTLKNYK